MHDPKETLRAEKALALADELSEPHDLVLPGPELDATLQAHDEAIVDAVRRLYQRLAVYSRALAREHHASSPQLACLASVAREGSTSASRIAREVRLSLSTVVRLLDRLETKGLIERARSKEDRRLTLVAIRPEGRLLVDNVRQLRPHPIARALERLDAEEKRALANGLGRMVELMEGD